LKSTTRKFTPAIARKFRCPVVAEDSASVIVFGRIAQDRTATVKSLQSSSNRTIGTLPNFARAAMATSCGRHARLQRESLPVRPVAGLAQGEEPGQPCDDPGAGGGVVTANRRFAPSRARHCRSTTCHNLMSQMPRQHGNRCHPRYGTIQLYPRAVGSKVSRKRAFGAV
jgi:hypothetical protein